MAKLTPRADSGPYGSLPGVLFHGTPVIVREKREESLPPESAGLPWPKELTLNRDWVMPMLAPAEPMPRLVSSGTYDVAVELGGGAMATVYMAVKSGSSGFKKVVALKRIHRHLAGNATFVDMLIDEARLASRINHPNVCQVLDFGCDDSGYYIAMEFLAGQTVQSVYDTLAANPRLVSRPRHQFIASRVIASLAQGLHAAHSLRGDDGLSLDVVHRDVTPHNLFLLYDGVAKVTDFGVARARSRIHHTTDDSVKGKLAYMAPEQMSRGKLDRRADVFSLGVVLWELLTGHRLFDYKNEAETLAAVCSGSVLAPSLIQTGISPKLDAIVLRALCANEDERFQTAREFGSALESFLAQASDTVPQVDLVDWLEELFPGAAAQMESLQRHVIDAPAAAVDLGNMRVPVVPVLAALGTASVSDDDLWPVGSSEPPSDTPAPPEQRAPRLVPISGAPLPALSISSGRHATDSTSRTFLMLAGALALGVCGGIFALRQARAMRDSGAALAAAPPTVIEAAPVAPAAVVESPVEPAPAVPAAVAAPEALVPNAPLQPLQEKLEPERAARAMLVAPATATSAGDSAAAPGSVFISTSGSSAAVYVNGSQVGQTPMLLALPQGHRSLTLVPTNGGAAREVTVEVGARGTVMLRVPMPAAPAPVPVPASSAAPAPDGSALAPAPAPPAPAAVAAPASSAG